MPNGIDYTAEEWRESAGHLPLKDRPPEDLLLLHRHYMWANQQREAFFALLGNPSGALNEPGPLMMATREMGFMFAWYGLLWAVVEACIDPDGGRHIDISGAFRRDIDEMANLLRRCRNAVLHVPRSGDLLDQRIQDLVAQPESAITIRRIHRGFSRLFLDEFKRSGRRELSGSDRKRVVDFEQTSLCARLKDISLSISNCGHKGSIDQRCFGEH